MYFDSQKGGLFQSKAVLVKIVSGSTPDPQKLKENYKKIRKIPQVTTNCENHIKISKNSQKSQEFSGSKP